MLVDLSKKEIKVIMSSLMNDDTTHTELYEKLSNLNQVCTCKEDKWLKKDPKTGLWKHPQPVSRDSLNNTDEMIDNFVAECERQAAKLEITVDYYIKEFI